MFCLRTSAAQNLSRGDDANFGTPRSAVGSMVLLASEMRIGLRSPHYSGFPSLLSAADPVVPCTTSRGNDGQSGLDLECSCRSPPRPAPARPLTIGQQG
jgi:hypothetical protein